MLNLASASAAEMGTRAMCGLPAAMCYSLPGVPGALAEGAEDVEAAGALRHVVRLLDADGLAARAVAACMRVTGGFM